MSPRIVPIQWLRAVASLLVVVTHIAASVIDHRAPVPGMLPPVILRAALMGLSGVDLFFVISGIVMARTLATGTSAPGRFLIDRWWRIVPLFVIVSPLAWLIEPRAVAIEALVSTITIFPVLDGRDYHSPMLTVGWTLAFELAFYAIVAVVIRWGSRSPATLVLLTSAAALIGTMVHAPWAPLRILFNPLQAEFALGVLVWIGWQRGWFARLAAPLAVLGIACLLLTSRRDDLLSLGSFVSATSGQSGWPRLLAWGLPWAAITAATLARFGAPRPATSPTDTLARLGDASFALYLLHPCIIMALEQTLRAQSMGIAAYGGVVIAASVAAALAFHRWVERPLLASRRRRPPRGGRSLAPA